MQINLRIESLALRGLQFSPADQAELVASLQLELGRLLTSNADSQPWETLAGQEHLQVPAIRYQPGNSPTRLGRAIASSLHSGFQPQNAVSPTSDPA